MIGYKFSKNISRHYYSRYYCANAPKLTSTHEKLEKKFSVGLNKELGISLVSVEDKGVTMEMPITDIHMNALGIVHGGSICTLIDTCAGYAAWANKPEKASKVVVTDISISLVHNSADSKGQKLISTARQLHGGNLTQVWLADVMNKKSGKLVATAKLTAMNIYPRIQGLDGTEEAVNSEETTKSKILKNLSKLDGRNFNVRKMTKEEIAQKFDSHAPHWKHFVTICKYSIFDWLTAQCKTLKNKTKLRILGCGPGLIGTHLVQNGIKGNITALDISPKMLEIALQSCDSEGNKIYSQGHVHDLDESFQFLDGKFDLITCFGTLEMLKDQNNFLHQVKQKLSSDGTALLSYQWNIGDDKNPLDYQGMQHLTISEVQDIAGNNSLRVLDMATLDAGYLMPSSTASATSVQDPSGQYWNPVPMILVKLAHLE